MGYGIVARALCGVDSLADFFWVFWSAWVLGSALGLALVRGIVMRAREIVARIWHASCVGWILLRDFLGRFGWRGFEGRLWTWLWQREFWAWLCRGGGFGARIFELWARVCLLGRVFACLSAYLLGLAQAVGC